MTKTKINCNYLTIYRLQNPNKLKHPPPPPPNNPMELCLSCFISAQPKAKTRRTLKKKTYTYISQIGNLPEIPLCKKKWTFLLCGSSA